MGSIEIVVTQSLQLKVNQAAAAVLLHHAHQQQQHSNSAPVNHPMASCLMAPSIRVHWSGL